MKLRSVWSRLLGVLHVSRWETTHRQVAWAAIIVAFFTFGSKLVSAAKELLVARQFGTADQLDAFLVAWVAPTLVISIVGNSLNYSFMPVYLETGRREGPGAAQKLLASTTAATFACLAALALLMAALAPVVLPWVARGFDPAKAQLTARLIWWLLPAMMVSAVTTTWTAVLNSRGRFAWAAASALAIPAVTVAVLVLFGRRFGVHALAIGTVIGYLLEALLVAVAVTRQGISIVPRWTGASAALRRVAAQLGPAMSAMIFTSVNPVIDQVMAAQLGPGSVAALGYGNKLVSFGVGVVYSSIASAMLPHFSRLAVARDWAGLHRSIRSYSAAMSALTIPATLALMAFSQPIVRVLFERGAFTPQDTVQVARIQAFYLLQIPFIMVSVMFSRLLVATANNQALVRVNVIAAVLNVSLNWVLIRFMGTAGIALSTSLVYASTCTLNYFNCRRFLADVAAKGPGIGNVRGEATP